MSTASQSPASDGMSGLQLMPFPALNPWNWGALNSARMALASLEGARFCVNTWRATLDAMQHAIREQDDLALEQMASQLRALDHKTGQSAPNGGETSSPASIVLQMWLSAGDLALQSQRNALRLLAHAPAPGAQK